MNILGICSSDIWVTNLEFPKIDDYEIIKLYQEGIKVYDKVVVFNPAQVSYKFIRESDKPIFSVGKQNLTNLTTMIVRRVRGREQSSAILVYSLGAWGCDIIDPMERFQGSSPSKLLTTFERHQKGVGINSYIASCIESAVPLIQELAQTKKFPLIVKPIDGRQGEGIELLKNSSMAIEYTHSFFDRNKNNDLPILLQEFVELQTEYRVLLVNGKSLGVAQKKAQLGHLAANSAQGGTFVATDVPDVVDFAIKNVQKQGILGVDVAQDSEGRLYIIEANYSPRWGAFERATQVNVAQEIINFAIERVK
jgi:glutathione synthase/RimK-type ligase-like ATP-grasp enzyme